MLSLTPLKSVAKAMDYYFPDNSGDYYTSSHESREMSSWWGKGADALSLRGPVEPQQFQLLLEGVLPHGQQLGRVEGNGAIHRPGYDLTFSAPKSVSILSEVGGDTRIHEAHDKAVNTALIYLQQHAAQTRRSCEGEIVFEATDNLIIAKFPENTSRAHDPQYHTHCVVMNVTQRSDGSWRSLSSEKFFELKMLGGVIYRAHLAVAIQELGYTIEKTHDDGRFEIKGVPHDLIETFSKRREAIERAMEEHGLEGAKAAEKVTLITRPEKESVDAKVLMEKWKATCAEHYFQPSELVEASKARIFIPHDMPTEALHALRYACSHLSEREAVFTHPELLRVSLSEGLGRTSLPHIEAAILKAQKQGALITIQRDGMNYPGWTTPEALKLEQDTISKMLDGRFSVSPLSSESKVSHFLSTQNHLNSGQKEALKLILTTHDRIIGIQGYAGTGKTTMLASLKKFAEREGFVVKGLAPTATAANRLREGAGIESTTLDSFLIAHNKAGATYERNTLYILDESSMASTPKMNALLKAMNERQSRLTLGGDTQQFGAIEWGKPFYQLQKAGMQTAVMHEILRQKTPELLEAVKSAIRGDMREALNKVGDNIFEVPDKHKRLESVANHYLSFSHEAQSRTLVITPANEDRQVVNQLIREGLKTQGILTGAEITTTTLVNRGLTLAQKSNALSYHGDDFVRFNKSYSSLGVKSGEYWRVTSIKGDENQITLQNSEGKNILWSPHLIGGRRQGAIEVYQAEERTLIVGDTIRWLRNERHQHILNSETARVVGIQNGETTVSLTNGKTLTINLADRKYQHWDHAYASTAHAAQGGSYDIVIIHDESYRKHLTTQHAFYVKLSRACYEVHLYIDNKAQYLKTLNTYIGEKTSALEIFHYQNNLSRKEMTL